MASRRRPSGKNPIDKSSTTRKDGAKRRPGRPPVHLEAWTKVTVVLFDRQIAFLDRLAASLRTEHGTRISRAQLIRALVDSVGESSERQATTAGLNAAILSKLGVADDEG